MFADSSGWAHFVDRTQKHNLRAVDLVRAVRAAGERLVTTNLVLAELTALLTRPIRMSRPQQIAFLTTIRTAAWIDVVRIDPVKEAAAWRLWETRPDKEWTMVDCASFIIMQDRGLIDALTSDHHFEQAGFIRLLK